jgi:PIN domain nuclease of toxin-antitoxin system
VSGTALLLDTCALIWLANGDRMRPEATDAMIAAAGRNEVFLSPVSAWEVGRLSQPCASTGALRFDPDAKTWFQRAAAGPGVRLTPLTPDIAIDAACLPGDFHADPADRLIVSTARHIGAAIVTRDRAILTYASQGYVEALAC